MDTLRASLCNAACTLLLANSVDKRYVKESKRTWTELYSVVTSTKRTREPLASKCRCNAICLREQFNLSSAKPALASSFNNSIQRGADLTGVQIVEHPARSSNKSEQWRGQTTAKERGVGCWELALYACPFDLVIRTTLAERAWRVAVKPLRPGWNERMPRN